MLSFCKTADISVTAWLFLFCNITQEEYILDRGVIYHIAILVCIMLSARPSLFPGKAQTAFTQDPVNALFHCRGGGDAVAMHGGGMQ